MSLVGTEFEVEDLWSLRLFNWTGRINWTGCMYRHITRSYRIQSGILLGVRYLATSLYDPAIFVLL